MLHVTDLHLRFGGLRALDGVSLEVAEGSITGLIGPNGAGKTTLFNTVAGVLRPAAGQVWLDGEDITGCPPHELFHKGLLRTFQLPHEFGRLTVRENLLVVPGGQAGETLWRALFDRATIRAEEQILKAKADNVLEFLDLAHVADLPAGHLSGGQKKLLELGRTMMTDAKIVLLDEISAGVNRTLLKRIGETILRLNREQGTTFCLIEHDMDFVARLCDPVIVMAEGGVMTKGSVATVMADETVAEVYLGGGTLVQPGRLTR